MSASASSSSSKKPSATPYVFTFVATVAVTLLICAGLLTRTYLYRRRLRNHLLSLNISAADREEIQNANSAQLRAIANFLEDMGLTSGELSSRRFLSMSDTPFALNQTRRARKELVLGRTPDLWEVTTRQNRLDFKCDTATFGWKDLRPISLSVSTKAIKPSIEQSTPVLNSSEAPTMLRNLFPIQSTPEFVNPISSTTPLDTASSASTVLDRVTSDLGSHTLHLSVLIKMPEDNQSISAQPEEQESDLDEDERGLHEMGDVELGVTTVNIH